MKIKNSRDLHSSLGAAYFQRYYADSKWHKESIRTMRQINKVNVGKANVLSSQDDQTIKSRTPSDASSRH